VILSVPPEKAAKGMLFLASARFTPLDNDRAGDSGVAVGTNGSVGSGCYAVGEDSDTVNLAKSYDGLRREGFEELVWDHTQDAFACISSGKTISGMVCEENTMYGTRKTCQNPQSVLFRDRRNRKRTIAR